MRTLSLFSGIGGFDIAAESVGFEIVGQVEINQFCIAILNKHWPKVKRLENIKDVIGTEFGAVDFICGGPPCQPASVAGKRLGKQDDRWLWPETIRLVKAIRPRWILFENPTGLLSLQGGVPFDEVCTELENVGYYNYRENGENKIAPIIIPAAAVNAPHRRDRVWIVARLIENSVNCGNGRGSNGDQAGLRRPLQTEGSDRHAADAEGQGLEGGNATRPRSAGRWIAEHPVGNERDFKTESWNRPWIDVAIETCSRDVRVDDGLPAILDGVTISKSKHREERLKALGNAIVPQVAIEIMRAIKESA